MAGVSICGDLMSVAGCLKRRQGDSNSGVSRTAAANDVITDLASSCASSREFSRATVLQARSHEELLGDKDRFTYWNRPRAKEGRKGPKE
mmetsp:Transcript_33240/g.75212  ORF Transcript_33240/g.75212 Transcript_33240/m.75212 type:complete len:90 (-) Transcript_33240:92-361(-)